jgi:hypothetical protein
MTRKHFEALAAALRFNAPNPNSETYEAQAKLFESIVNAVAKTCVRANSRFDYKRFEKASGLGAIHNRRNLRDAIETDEGQNIFLMRRNRGNGC